VRDGLGRILMKLLKLLEIKDTFSSDSTVKIMAENQGIQRLMFATNDERKIGYQPYYTYMAWLNFEIGQYQKIMKGIEDGEFLLRKEQYLYFTVRPRYEDNMYMYQVMRYDLKEQKYSYSRRFLVDGDITSFTKQNIKINADFIMVVVKRENAFGYTVPSEYIVFNYELEQVVHYYIPIENICSFSQLVEEYLLVGEIEEKTRKRQLVKINLRDGGIHKFFLDEDVKFVRYQQGILFANCKFDRGYCYVIFERDQMIIKKIPTFQSENIHEIGDYWVVYDSERGNSDVQHCFKKVTVYDRNFEIRTQYTYLGECKSRQLLTLTEYAEVLELRVYLRDRQIETRYALFDILRGETIWEIDLEGYDTVAHGAEPILWKNKIILSGFKGKKGSKGVIVLDKQTGELLFYKGTKGFIHAIIPKEDGVYIQCANKSCRGLQYYKLIE